jgi:hypothetical protein
MLSLLVSHGACRPQQVPAEELPENAPPPWAQPYEDQQRGSGAQSENMALKQQIKQLLQERESQVRMYEAYKVHTKRLETELEANRVCVNTLLTPLLTHC